MPSATLLHSGPISVVDYRCTSGPHDKPFVELHDSFAVSYVRKGSFGYRYRGVEHELVAGSILLGRPDEEFLCTHEHHACGDECLSLHVTPPATDALGVDVRKLNQVCAIGCLPPLPATMVTGELAQASAIGASDLGLEESALLLLDRVVNLVDGAGRRSSRVTSRDRARAVQAALWIDANSQQDVNLTGVAQQTGLSVFHFLRVFSQVLGVTPHQYLLRSRLRHAARLLVDEERPVTEIALDVGFADLSNFVRTFRRAAGVSPRAFRQASMGERELITARFSKFQ